MADSLNEFLAEHCIEAPGATAVASELYRAYCCSGGKWSGTAFGRAMAERFPRSKATSGPNRNKFVYQGVRLRAAPGASDPAHSTDWHSHQPPSNEPGASSPSDSNAPPAGEADGGTRRNQGASQSDKTQQQQAPQASQTSDETETGDRDEPTTAQPVSNDQRQGESGRYETTQPPVAPQTTPKYNETNEGDVTLAVSEPAGEYAVAGSSFAREPESRAQATNRWILEGRRWEVDRRRKDLIRQCVATGLTRRQAADHAWNVCLAEFPPPDVEPSTLGIPEPEEEPPTPEPEPDAPEPEEPAPQPIPSDQGVPGLGTIPEDWPKLAANASLQVEIAWVTANRLRVRDGAGVDLSRALSPAPSYSALSWLETSILFPSKFADISVKATSQQDDEREHVRREKLAIEEIRGLLKEMLED